MVAVVKPYPIGGAETRPEATGLGGGSGPLSAFGQTQPNQVQQVSGQGRDLMVAGAELEKASENTAKLALGVAKEANDTRVQDLNNQFITGQQQLLYTGDNAFYKKQGADAITGAPAATTALIDLQKTILDQTSNDYQKDKLRTALNFHVQDATNAMSRHVASQSVVWRDAVAKGTVANSANAMVLDYNDPEKVKALSDGIYQTEYDRAFKQTGSPEAAQASATAARSGALKATITRLAVDSPPAAQRLLDANRDKIDAGDAPALTAVIKDADLKRKSQNIIGIVGATGGVSPDYEKRVPGAEGGSPFIENKIGALGKYQFTPDTYTGLAQQTEWGKGKSQSEVRAMLLDPKEGPGRQDELIRKFDDISVKKLGEAGVPVNDLTLYTTHFLGHGAGPAILKLPDDTPLQAGLVQAHGGDAAYAKKVIEANPFLGKVETVGDLKALMAQKIGAPQSLAVTGTPTKPNLDAMLSAGLVLAGSDPDLRDRVTQGIKTDYATKHAIYTAQIGAVEKQAFGHIDAGGTVENMPSPIKAALDADGLAKVQTYESKVLEKRRKDNAEAAEKGLTDLMALGQLTPQDVEKQKNNLPANQYLSWQKLASGRDRIDDPTTFERLQRGLGTRDMRDDIFAAHNSGDISNETRDSLLDKNATLLTQNAPATPYKINHDRITRSLDPGLMGSGIYREIYGRAVKEYDQYVGANPQREGETSEQYSKRVSDFSEDTIRRHQLINTQEIAVSKPVPVNTAFSRSDMTGLPRADATKKIAAANADLAAKFAAGTITEDQYNRDAIALMDWLQFVQTRKEPEPKK